MIVDVLKPAQKQFAQDLPARQEYGERRGANDRADLCYMQHHHSETDID